MILLPDNWSASTYSLSNTNDIENAHYSNNIISVSQWNTYLGANGAVFLPAAGYRSGTSVYDYNYAGYYWSASYDWSTDAFGFVFANYEGMGTTYYDRCRGHSVRLVRNAE